MAPKRKRGTNEAATPATRATRSSTRNGEAATSEADGAASLAHEDTQTQDPKPKKSRKAPTKAAKATVKTTLTFSGQTITAEGGSGISTSTSIGSSTKPQKVVKAAKSIPDSEPYTVDAANLLFEKYADEDDPSVIGPEGLEKLCSDADIPLDGALPLVLAWQFGASEMAKLTKNEWEKGTSQLQISSLSSLSVALRDLEDLIILDKPPLKTTAAAAQKKKAPPEPYNRARYTVYAADKRKAFNEFYVFCFVLAKPPQARNIDMQTASALWSVLLLPRYGLIQDILDFISEKGTYKGVNKDLWTMVFEFCQTVSPNLDNFEADGAWPTMLDEFVAWKKAK